QVPGLFNMYNFSLTYSFNQQRFWSGGELDSTAAGGHFVPRNRSLAFNGAPLLLMKYYTLPETMVLPLNVRYPYYSVVRYVSPSAVNIAANATNTIDLNNIQPAEIARSPIHFLHPQSQCKYRGCSWRLSRECAFPVS